MKSNNQNCNADFLSNLSANLNHLSSINELGKDFQSAKVRLSKTDKGARTNARIEASQKGEGFNENETSAEELSEVGNDITDELLNRAIEDLFRI